MKFIATFGETMLRISPIRQGERISTSNLFSVEPGGSESNVAIALSSLGHKVRHITRVPTSPLGNAIIRNLNGFGVNTANIEKVQGRVGCYWTETGVGLRPYQVIYDRKDSVFSNWSFDKVKWNKIFDSCFWLHVSGITPALNKSSKEGLFKMLKNLPENVTLSLDLNYREKLWDYIESADKEKKIHEYMNKLSKYCNYVFGNETDFQKALGIDPIDESGDRERYSSIAKEFFETNPKANGCAMGIRKASSASNNGWKGMLFLNDTAQGIKSFYSPSYNLEDIVDRIGAGDSFAAGVIHGLIRFKEDGQKTVDFATTLSALKHSIRGDACTFDESEVWQVFKNSGAGSINR